MPAWKLRGIENQEFPYLHRNPQNNILLPFENNIHSRITEINNFNNRNNL